MMNTADDKCSLIFFCDFRYGSLVVCIPSKRTAKLTVQRMLNRVESKQKTTGGGEYDEFLFDDNRP